MGRPRVTGVGEMEREVIGKGGPDGVRRGSEVGGVERSGDGRRDEEVVGEERGKEETVDAGRPGVRGSRVIGDVKVGVDRVKKVESGFEGLPERGEGRGRESWRGGRRVQRRLDEVKVSTEEGGDGVVGGEHGLKKESVEVELTTGVEVDVEELERCVGGSGGSVAAELDAAFGDGRKRNV